MESGTVRERKGEAVEREREREREREVESDAVVESIRESGCYGVEDRFSRATTQSDTPNGMIFGMTARHVQSFILLPRCSRCQYR